MELQVCDIDQSVEVDQLVRNMIIALRGSAPHEDYQKLQEWVDHPNAGTTGKSPRSDVSYPEPVNDFKKATETLLLLGSSRIAPRMLLAVDTNDQVERLKRK